MLPQKLILKSIQHVMTDKGNAQKVGDSGWFTVAFPMTVSPDLKEKFKNTERDNRKTRRNFPKVMSRGGRLSQDACCRSYGRHNKLVSITWGEIHSLLSPLRRVQVSTLKSNISHGERETDVSLRSCWRWTWELKEWIFYLYWSGGWKQSSKWISNVAQFEGDVAEKQSGKEESTCGSL